MNPKNTVAILGAGRLQQPFIHEAKALGLRVIALDQNSEAFAARDADLFIETQISDAAATLQTLEPHKNELLFVCTVATDFTHTVGYINDALTLPGVNTRQGRVLTHKGAMRDFCREHKHEHPPFICSKEKMAVELWAQTNPSPAGFVIKPAQNMGARGVMFLADSEELSFAFEFSAAQDKQGEVIFEHYIPAREISVDALCFEGKVFLTGVADRLIEIKDRHFFIENGHNLPGKFTPTEYDSIQGVMQRYADSLHSLSQTPYHGALKGDLRITAEGTICIGEIAGRLSGGFMSTHTYPAAHKRSLMQMYIRLMRGEKQVLLSHTEAIAATQRAIERSIYAEPGEIEGLPSAAKLDALKKHYATKGLLELICNYSNGDVISSLQNNVGKVYHSVFVGPNSEAVFNELRTELHFKVNTPVYDGRSFAKLARANFNHKFCWVCKVCDGDYCASGVPGMGGRGEANTFRDNIMALAEYKILTGYTSVEKKVTKPNTKFLLFGEIELAAPIFSAPITGSVTNMGGSITEYDYAFETGRAMVDQHLMPTFGDGAAPDKYRVGLHAIKCLKTGIPIFKPRTDQSELLRRIGEAQAAGAVGWGMDIDGVSFKTMVNKNASTEHKSAAQLKELASAANLPFLIKGVMSISDAEAAISAGAAAIVVSNHGGRVLDGMPGTARVLPQIASYVRSRAPHVQILVDGGIRSGTDIFRMLALGADAVMIGRPIAIMAVAMGRSGVKSLLDYWRAELEQTMRVLGIESLKDINPHHIQKFL